MAAASCVKAVTCLILTCACAAWLKRSGESSVLIKNLECHTVYWTSAAMGLIGKILISSFQAKCENVTIRQIAMRFMLNQESSLEPIDVVINT